MKIKVPKFSLDLGFSTTAERSVAMSKIRSKNTKQELVFRKALWANGIRYRINNKKISGTPDISIKRKMLVIFIDGDFWHGYNWPEKKKRIKSNREYWIPKIERNMQRDGENNKALAEQGYTVLRFWEHEIKKNLDECIKRVLKILE